MKKLYIANTNFEFELAENKILSLRQMMEQSPICLQLQFLPLLFAGPEDEVLVTGFPDNTFDTRMVLDAREGEIHSWGWSRSIAEWAKARGIAYNMPSWEVVREVNSKSWSFENSPKLEGAACIYSREELERWVVKGRKAVAKSCFGLSGMGNKVFTELSPQLLSFCEREWKEKRPVIVEPWVDRILDFSTQWQVEKDTIAFLGATKMLNSADGTYMGTIVGYDADEKHLVEAMRILRLAQEMGYFGYVGIDAMVYQKEGKEFLQPIVEVNARMTMALAAILVQQKRFPSQKILFQYDKFEEGILPKNIHIQNKIIRFNRQLQITIIDS